MEINEVVGLTGGNDSTWFEIVAIEDEGTTKYYPAIVDGVERSYSDFANIGDYLAHKVERERRTVRLTVAGNAVVAEDAVKQALGCQALATSPTSVDVYPDQPLPNAAAMLGRMTSEKKAAASRANGRRGGRPRTERE